MVVEYQQSWLTWMGVHHLMNHKFAFTTRHVGRQPTRSQDFQPLTPQTLAQPAAGIHCVLSEYSSGNMATVMISEEHYWGTYCPSPVINFTPEATALFNHTLVGRLIPPLRCNSARKGAPHCLLPLHSPDWCFSVSYPTRFPHFRTLKFPPAQLGLDCRCYIDIRTPYAWPPVTFRCSKTSISTPASLSELFSLEMALLCPCWYFAASIWHSSIFVGAPQPSFGALFHSVLL